MKMKFLQMSAVVVLILAPLTFTGCKTQQPIVATYRTLASTQAAVMTAREAFLQRYQQGGIDAFTAQRALDASNNFNQAFSNAVLAARTTQAPTPEHVAQAAGQFLAIVATFIQPKP